LRCPSGEIPAEHVAGRPLRGLPAREGRALAAERLQIELRRDRDDRDAELPVHLDDERLEDAPGVESERLGRLEPVRLGLAIVGVLVRPERHAGALGGRDRGCPGHHGSLAR
jgi:hypothetical protein